MLSAALFSEVRYHVTNNEPCWNIHILPLSLTTWMLEVKCYKRPDTEELFLIWAVKCALSHFLLLFHLRIISCNFLISGIAIHVKLRTF